MVRYGGTVAKEKQTAVGGETPTNDAAEMIEATAPVIVHVAIEGTAAMLFHRWSVEAVAEKAAAAKGSKAKKTDDPSTYVYRDENGVVCLPGEYLRMSVVETARYRQDPRSPRKSARDLLKAGLVSMTELAPITTAAGKLAEEWDYLDARRVTVQRAGITRERPAFLKGWRAELDLQILTPEYISTDMLLSLITDAGRLTGLADFRPTFGRFQVIKFERFDAV